MIIIPRHLWGARPPRSRSTIPTPTPELWLHHSANSNKGAGGVRSIQKFHMDPRPVGRGWSDIAYSYLIDRLSLDVFEGRGAGVLGGHTFGRNTRSHGICVMGNFHGVHAVTDALINRIAELVAHGHVRGWWPAELTGGHRDVRPTDCPGDALYRAIPTINDRIPRYLNGVPPVSEPDPIVQRSQRRLEQHGYTLPRFGADGIWGNESDDALLAALNDVSKFAAERDAARHDVARLEALAADLRRQLDGSTAATEVGSKVIELAAHIRHLLDQ